MTKLKGTYKESISELHGHLVVSYDEGDRVGNVGDIYFDRKSCAIKGISLSSKILEPGEKNFIKFKDVLKLGNSVVIISKKSALGKMPRGLESSCLRFLKSIKIVTQDGENLGEMADLNVMAESGIIQEIILWGNKKLRIDAEKDKIKIGPDMIVVPSAYKANVTHYAKQSEDKLSHVVKSAEKVTRRFADSINEAVHKVTAVRKSDSVRGRAKQAYSTVAPSKVSSRQEKATKKTATKKKAAKKASTKKATVRKKAAKKSS